MNVLVGLGEPFAAEFWRNRRQNDNVDGDVVDITNINRQLPALHSTVTTKITIVGDRLLDINPELHRLTRVNFYHLSVLLKIVGV
jgi:tRNA A37 threonylcarbamoyladenosine dehydratase